MSRLFAAVLILVAVAVAPRHAAAVEVKEIVSESGVTAWLVEDHSNPIIAVRFAFRGGAALDPAGKGGLANMVSGLLDEGAGDLDNQAFQRTLEEHSIRLGFSAGKDTFGGSMSMLTAESDVAWDMLRLAITEPRFDAEPVERIRGQILAGLRQRAEDPDSIAGLALFETLFPDHPYATPTDGTEDSVTAITVDDLRGFVARRLALENLVVGVVGDISVDELRTALDRVFGGLPAEMGGEMVADVEPRATGGLDVIRKPVPQSTVLFAQPGPSRDDPDFYALYVMNYLLGGGGFTSRLYEEVREKRGLAYSVYSYIAPYDHTAIIAGGAGTANARVVETIEVVRAEWRRMAEDGVTAEELADAKTYLTGSYPLRFTSSGGIADMLVGVQLDNLGRDYFDIRNGLIEAVTLDDINRVAAEWLDPDSLTIVVVGDPANLETAN